MARKRTPPADLSEFDAVVQAQEQGIVVPILHMDGKSDLGFSIRIAGPDSERAQAARAKLQAEFLERDSLEPLSPDEAYAQGTRFLARISIEFVGRAVLDKKELKSTEEDFVKLYSRFRFIRAQVDNKQGSREAFLSVLDGTQKQPSGDDSPESQPE